MTVRIIVPNRNAKCRCKDDVLFPLLQDSVKSYCISHPLLNIHETLNEALILSWWYKYLVSIVYICSHFDLQFDFIMTLHLTFNNYGEFIFQITEKTSRGKYRNTIETAYTVRLA